jgi:L-iditol 2-dehydrogenase
MKAVVKERRGPGGVAYREVPDREPGEGLVKVRVAFAGVCGSDIHILHDRIGLRLAPPVVMGHEFIGEIAEVGPDVSGWQPGDAVVAETAFAVCGKCRMCRSGHDNVCPEKELIGYVHDGAFAPFVIVPASRLHTAPGALDDPGFALAEPLAGCTHAMLEQCTVVAGDVVVIVGPGTVGLLSLQLAKAMGAKVILCGRSEHRLELGARLGADHTINLRETSPQALVERLTQREGCDIFVECSGSQDAITLGLSLLRRRGQFVQQGLSEAPVSVPFDQVAYKELVVSGSLGQKWTAWERALALLRDGQIDLAPMVSDVLPLDRWDDAFALAEGRQRHKIVFSPAHPL